MKTIEAEKRGFKRIIKVQLVIMAILITVGGIAYGISTGKWPTVHYSFFVW